MPTYEYLCRDCGHQLEAEQSIKDQPLKTCPACSKDTLDRQIGRTSFVLQGGGWASSGYSSGKASKK